MQRRRHQFGRSSDPSGFQVPGLARFGGEDRPKVGWRISSGSPILWRVIPTAVFTRHTRTRHDHNQMSASNPSTGKRLDSWKEIAVFFGRDERTVSRWEKLG